MFGPNTSGNRPLKKIQPNKHKQERTKDHVHSHANSSRKLCKVRRPKTSDGVPPTLRREPTRAAARVRARRDVVERGLPKRVQERVEEPERAPSTRDEPVVEQRDDGRERRRRRGRAVHSVDLPPFDDIVRDALCGDVGVRAAVRVEAALVGAAERGEVAVDGGGLVGGRAEDVREAAGGEVGCGLWHASGSADGGHEGAAGGEGGDERRAGVVEPRARDAAVPRGEEHGHAASAELGVRVAQVAVGERGESANGSLGRDGACVLCDLR